ncbi:MAG TPA: MBL fold metallo-hydrolase [Myxococcota bacterium]|nr:MBL fold metallo-hydrolase [Myxococcota bacterium]
MGITNRDSGTRVDEIADRVYRISTPVPPANFPGGFTFNQFLVDDDEPLLFHTGLRRMFPLVKQAIESVLPLARLRHVSFSHFEADECGSLNELLAAAPNAKPLCGNLAAAVSVDDVADRPARTLQDGESLATGRNTVRFFHTPHLPHAWECGYLFEARTQTLFCGDLYTQGGHEHVPLTQADILGPSENALGQFDYFAYAPRSRAHLERLAELRPRTLACMHGSSWQGDGAGLLRALADSLESRRPSP